MKSPKHRALLALAAGLLLAACQTTQGPTATTVATSQESPLQSIGPTLDQLAAESMPKEAPQLAAKPKINDDPAQVVGLLPRDLYSLLGQPQFLRRDLSAQVWQYRRSRCVVDLFLYRDDNAGPKVVHYEVRPLRHDASSLSETAQRGC
ncbi:MAG: hypothetical protein ACTSWM_03335, partial [Alphaproteobacteria bacterium]